MHSNRALVTGIGPLNGPTVYVNSNALGTTPVRALQASADPKGLVRRCKLINLHATNNVAWAVVPRNATAPTITASATGTATDAVILTPAQLFEMINVEDNMDLYVVGSAASTVYQLSYVEV